MKAAEVKAHFPNEAALCDMFMRDMRAMGGWTIYPETGGFDLLLVRDATGHQLGVEAKLALNAKVADQILPGDYMGWSSVPVEGPDFRAVIVPYISEASEGIAKMLGILGVQVLAPDKRYMGELKFTLGRHERDVRMLDASEGDLRSWDPLAWFDWNPAMRCALPEIVPNVRAGVPAPTQLTPWKIGALRVIADLQLDGFVTAKSVREHGIDARRFCASDGWLTSIGNGRWVRGTLPAFEAQHPEAYAKVLAEACAKRETQLQPQQAALV